MHTLNDRVQFLRFHTQLDFRAQTHFLKSILDAVLHHNAVGRRSDRQHKDVLVAAVTAEYIALAQRLPNDFLAYARSIQQICYIECISNGTMPLARYRRALEYLDQLTFSLDSACREKAIIRPDWAFDLVVKKISALKSTKKPVSIVFTLHHKNIDDCDELLAFAHRLDTPCRFSIFTIDSFHGRTSPLTLTESDYRSFHSFITSKQSDIAIDDGSLGNEISCVESCGAGSINCL